MMKTFFSFLLVLSVSSLSAQKLKNFSVPKGYTQIAEAKGDLDKDGKDETVLIFNTNIKASDEQNPEGTSDYKRVFYILKKENNGLKVWKENSEIIFSSGFGFYPSDNTLTIDIKNNCLIIEQLFFTNSRHTQQYKHTFRFQNGDFYLIGLYDHFEDTCDFSFTNEINFSTGQVIIDREYSSCDDDTKVPENSHKEFTHQFPALIKMNDFFIGDHKFRLPGLKEDFVF
ncbi:hypothetical protein J2786_001913 [Chryseobacterium vietnamense]|uniref:Uncharacterized protein n=1 Tax=Chryseobacterium vietnamense TaxID=866785 RepID=A0ACC6J6X0_9FLAO|nr:hypothetical protein [Chryseobacterium vietnamense]MDR6458806.1 hypothetical protein [Chryseobacterium vietnamense]